MTRIYNRAEAKNLRQNLRNDMTKPEMQLWAKLRRKQVSNARFRRQYSVGPYVLDFYCPELRLAVEIDGDTHLGDEARAHDRQRQDYAEALGVCFLRFTNLEVASEMESVLETIARRVTELQEDPL